MKNKKLIAVTVTALMGVSPFALGAGDYDKQQQEDQRVEQSSSIEGEQQQQQEQQLDKEDIEKVQQALNEKGFHADSVDGQMGPATRSAIQSFQESEELTASGELDQETIDALGVDVNLKQAQQEQQPQEQQESEAQLPQEQKESEDLQIQEQQESEAQLPQEQQDSASMGSEAQQPQERQETISVDQPEQQAQQEQSGQSELSQDEIVEIQQTLNEEGFHSGNVDGQLGPETQEALKNFQEKEGLTASGEINQETIDALGVDVELKQAQEESESQMLSE